MEKLSDLRFVAMMLLVSLLSLSFSSCSSDDDGDDDGGGNNGGTEAYSIIGEWEAESSNSSILCIVFYTNGTGRWAFKPNDFSNFKYRYNEEDAEILVQDEDFSGSTWETLEIISLSENRLKVFFTDVDGYTETITFRKNTGEEDSTQDYQTLIVGTWLLHVDVQSGDDKKSVVTFNADGTYQAADYEGWSYGNSLGDLQGNYKGTYSISGSTISIKGKSQIAGEYIIDGIVENGMRLIKKSDPDSYPYLIGGWYDGEDDNENDTPDVDTADRIIGTWTVTQDDHSWKTILTFKSNGTYTADDYYDIRRNGAFEEYSGSCSGRYSITSSTLIIYSSSSSDYESMVTGSYKINTLTSTYFEVEDEDGYKCYGVKE